MKVNSPVDYGTEGLVDILGVKVLLPDQAVTVLC
jgi:hypothetical protein